MACAEKGERVLSKVASNAVALVRSSTARHASSTCILRLPTEIGTASASSRSKGFRTTVFNRPGKCAAMTRRPWNTIGTWAAPCFLQRQAGEMATTVRAIPRVAASSAMVPPSEFPARSTGISRPSSRMDSARPSTRFGIVGRVPPGSAGVEPKPAISNAMTRRVDSRYGVTALQAACDMPIPCRRTSGGPDPVSRKCHKAYPQPVMPGGHPPPRVTAVPSSP